MNVLKNTFKVVDPVLNNIFKSAQEIREITPASKSQSTSIFTNE